MLLKFSIENFRSIGERQILDLVPKREQNHRGHIADRPTAKALKVAGIYGANASGKSNLVSAIGVMETIVRISATQLNVGDPITPIVPFRLDASWDQQPTRFETVCAFGGKTYRYGFSATNKRIVEEWLHVAEGSGTERPWIERRMNSDGTMGVDLNGPLRDELTRRILADHTRENGLALSRGAEFNVESLSPLYLWFRENVWFRDLSKSTDVLTLHTAERMQGDDVFAKRVVDLMYDADVGISDITIHDQKRPTPDVPFGAPPEVKHIVERLETVFGDNRVNRHRVLTKHVRPDGRAVHFDLEDDESNGTRRLFSLCSFILAALDDGDVLVLDELDCSLHPRLTRKIVELFLSETHNRSGAQLIFTSHDTSLFDSKLFRRDQLWLAEKDERGQSLYSALSDFDDPPRKNEALAKRYLEGRYGGVPNFGPELDSLLVE